MEKQGDHPIIQEHLQGTLKKASKSAVWTTRVVPFGRNLAWPFLSQGDLDMYQTTGTSSWWYARESLFGELMDFFEVG